MRYLSFYFLSFHTVLASNYSLPQTLTRAPPTPTLEQRAGTIIVVTVTVTPSAAPVSPSYTNPELFEYDILNQTNYYRRQHNATGVIWNDTLATYAKQWAKPCNWKHSGGPYGENLAEGYSNVTAAVDAWAIESKKYDYNRPTGFSEKTGHFTQLVWKATTDVGCGLADCSANLNGDNGGKTGKAVGWFLVCEYWPPGNVVGDHDKYFEENVEPLVSLGTWLKVNVFDVWLMIVFAVLILTFL
ncbi:extracellular SCP domain protein Pry1, putative [Talaromyces stipitatus ATCC 10500]|uniref:Extracellular SCP domain protein Pry1, putative n=1 Tax=Talaromyces stipitatus (strain ATCC 10500 / CBS 375.48 / QM 6759 / NRRL 1006) TaxID=441959 RepID=B8MB27_TALSN|nr:extracellular SCP domain protein Pry1, putative [Talaromyces stipitatus ATCC 10500]EED18728.1 extracellular SCP domain protein Pry1, putative [Talaromyces stipitatus ATCC 10500]